MKKKSGRVRSTKRVSTLYPERAPEDPQNHEIFKMEYFFLKLTKNCIYPLYFNSNKKYVEIAEKHKNAFNLNSNLCSTFLNLHKNYEGICLKPFVKKII